MLSEREASFSYTAPAFVDEEEPRAAVRTRSFACAQDDIAHDSSLNEVLQLDPECVQIDLSRRIDVYPQRVQRA